LKNLKCKKILLFYILINLFFIFTGSSEAIIDKGAESVHLLRAGESLSLNDRYSIMVSKIDVDKNEAFFSILKDGEEIHFEVISGGTSLYYEGTCEIVSFYVETTFAGMNTNLVKIHSLYFEYIPVATSTSFATPSPTYTSAPTTTVTGVAQAGDWPMAYHDLARTGATDEVVEPPLKVLWKYKTGDKVLSSPAVSDGIVYVGSNDGYVYALDAKDGSLKWKYGTGDGVYSSPAVFDGTVYLGSYDGYVYALDAKDGKLKWKYGTGDGVYSSPAVFDGTVYIGSNDKFLYALDADTGRLKWKYNTGYLVLSSPAVSDGVVYISQYARGDGILYALDAGTGAIKWESVKIGDHVSSSAAVSDGTVYVGSNDHYVYALNTEDGRLKWKYKTEYTIMSSPAVSDGIIYIGSSDNYVYALNAEDGRLKWKYKTGYVVQSSPAVSDGTVYIGSGDKFLYALDTGTGALKWKYETGDKIQSSSPAVSNGAVYIGSWDGYLYAFVPAKKADAFLTAQNDFTPTLEKTSIATPLQTQYVLDTTPPQQNKSNNTTLIFGSIAILIGLVLLVSKSRRKKQGTSRPTSTTPIPTSLPVSHATQEAADRKQKRMEIQQLTELRNDASSKLLRAKGMLNKAGQLGIDTSQLEDILAKAEQAFQKENYTHTIDNVKKYLALIDQAEKNKKQLEQMRRSASDKIISAIFSIEKAERIGVTIKYARELNTKAQSAFDANDYNSAIRFANKSKDTAEQLIDESKPSISIELPPKMEYDAWKRRDLIVTNEGTAHAVAITITFLTALEVRDLKVIKRLDAGERKTINFNIKPTEKGEVPVDYSIEFKDLMDRVYKTEDTATIQITTGIEAAWGSTTSPIENVKTKSNKLVVQRKEEFFNGFIRLKISVQNKMQLTATDVSLDIDHDENVLRFDHHEPDTYAMKKEKIQLGNIPSNGDKTIALYFEGLICSKGGEINCRIDYNLHIGDFSNYV
jgi:eukaryotic-like serine/threonine-protein kinase